MLSRKPSRLESRLNRTVLNCGADPSRLLDIWLDRNNSVVVTAMWCTTRWALELGSPEYDRVDCKLAGCRCSPGQLDPATVALAEPGLEYTVTIAGCEPGCLAVQDAL